MNRMVIALWIEEECSHFKCWTVWPCPTGDTTTAAAGRSSPRRRKQCRGRAWMIRSDFHDASNKHSQCPLQKALKEASSSVIQQKRCEGTTHLKLQRSAYYKEVTFLKTWPLQELAMQDFAHWMLLHLGGDCEKGVYGVLPNEWKLFQRPPLWRVKQLYTIFAKMTFWTKFVQLISTGDHVQQNTNFWQHVWSNLTTFYPCARIFHITMSTNTHKCVYCIMYFVIKKRSLFYVISLIYLLQD